MLLRKARGGSGAAGHYWEHDGDVVEVPDPTALELLAVPGHDFVLVEPADLEQIDEPEPTDPEADADAALERPKRPYRRRTPVTEASPE